MGDEIENIDEPTSQGVVSHDPRTRRLLELLTEKSEDLADMLRGAWATLNSSYNPDMLPQVAHSMRELMEKAPIRLPSVPIQQGSNNLKNDVQTLGDKWLTVTQHIQDEATWSGEINEELRGMLNDFGTFFAEFSTKYQPRNEQNSALIQALDGSGGQVPEHILNNRLKQWNGLREFFLKVAHHNKATATVDDVTKAIVELEEFLLNLITPEPIPDLAELDTLIAEGEII